MKHKSSKFLCLALIKFAPVCCMDHIPTSADAEKMAAMYLATKALNDSTTSSSSKSGDESSPFEFDLTGKLCGNKRLNSQIRKILAGDNITKIKSLIMGLEDALNDPSRRLEEKEKQWLNDWLNQLYEKVKNITSALAKELENKEYKDEDYGDWNTVVIPEETKENGGSSKTEDSSSPAETKLEIEPKVEPAVLIDLGESKHSEESAPSTDIALQIEEVSADRAKNNNTPYEQEAGAEKKEEKSEQKPEDLQVPASKFPDNTPLTKSILAIHELDEQTRQANADLIAAQESVTKNDSNVEGARVAETAKLIESLKNLDSQKTAAIQTLESEIAKLEIQAKDKKELEPQVKELKEQLAQLKASQQKEQASMSTFQKWFTWGGWFGSK